MAHFTDMAQYEQLLPGAAERIFRMAEAETVDKSARQDRLADAEIAQAKSDHSSATAFLLIFTVAAIVFFAIGNTAAGLAMISLPVLGVIKTMWSSNWSPGKGRDEPSSTPDGAD